MQGDQNDSAPVLLNKPVIVGYMSVNAAREYCPDLSELKFITRFTNGTVFYNLNHNIHNAAKRTTDPNIEKIDLLLQFLLDQKNRIPKDVHFITYRRTLISIMRSAFNLESITVVASLFNGSIYLCSLERPEKVQQNQQRTQQEKMFCAWGYKFEQYMTADLPNLPPDIQKPVLENAEFTNYYYSQLANHTILYGAQIDGVLATDGRVPNPPESADYETNLNYLRDKKFVELKTNREIQNRRQEENFKKFKLFNCWCQCYLACLTGLIVGFRDDGGTVRRLQWFNTDDMVKYCKNIWNPHLALQFLNRFLTIVKETFENRAEQVNDDIVTMTPITLRFDIDTTCNISVSDDCEPILPDWFLKGKQENNQFV